jgi:hypothetical protein
MPTQPHFQWVPAVLYWGYYGLDMELTNDIRLVPWIQMNGAVMLFPLNFSMS